jgi:glycerol-3-phosphate O-acyltransferase
MEPTESLEREDCVSEALKYGRQAYLQRRISSESSIGKELFKNGFKMLESRQLADCSDPNVAENRMELARELRDLLRRLDLIRAIGVASRGTL